MNYDFVTFQSIWDGSKEQKCLNLESYTFEIMAGQKNSSTIGSPAGIELTPWRCQCNATEYKINRRVIRVETFEVCVPTHVALRMFIMQVLASQLPFLANRNAVAIPPLFWPVNCIKIGGHVALLSDLTVYSLYCGTALSTELSYDIDLGYC